MGVPQKLVAYIEIQDYLARENASQYKHEYLDGVIHAIQGEPVRGMAAVSQTHSRIIRDLSIALHTQLRGSPCEVLGNDMRLRIADDAIFYRDVLVHCQPTSQPSTTTELTEAGLGLPPQCGRALGRAGALGPWHRDALAQPERHSGLERDLRRRRPRLKPRRGLTRRGFAEVSFEILRFIRGEEPNKRAGGRGAR